MKLSPLFLLAICIGVPSPAPAVAADEVAIASKAQLALYLQSVKPGTSPLDRLSTGGRKRFLAQLDFGPRGLRSVPLGDAMNDLTHEQAVALFSLFGVKAYADGVGLSPAQRERIENERRLDAKARNCSLDTCPESAIERHYDDLVLAKSDFSMPDVKRFTLDRQRYDRLFDDYQTPDAIGVASSPDLRLLKRAAEQAVFFIPDAKHIDQLRLDLAQMQQRGMAMDSDYGSLYQVFIASRRFDEAAKLVADHPSMDVEIVPTLKEGESLPHGWPTALTLDDPQGVMVRQAFDLSAPLRIVVVASCHFSQDAARAIDGDPQLRSLFADNAIWLASQDESFSSVRKWNQSLPDQIIHIAWQNDEWSMLDSWAMPTFYVFRHGRLVKKFSGWKDLKTLKESLKQAQAMS